jgi:hypothetical protein
VLVALLEGKEVAMGEPRAITIRLAAEDSAQVDSIVAEVPLTNRHAVVRAAARLGLRHLSANPQGVIDLLRDQGGRVVTTG